MTRFRAHLTPSMMVSLVALFIALGGVSYAAIKLPAASVGTTQLKRDAVTGAKVNEASLGQVPSANTANTATTAESSNPTVFAKVESNGEVVPSLSKGVATANVTHPAKGVYCINPPGFTARGGQAIPQFEGTAGTTANLTIGGTGNCPAPAVQILTFITGAAPALENLVFYVELYR